MTAQSYEDDVISLLKYACSPTMCVRTYVCGFVGLCTFDLEYCSLRNTVFTCLLQEIKTS